MRLWRVIGPGLIAGLIAGFFLGLLIYNVSGPLIKSAERYEAQGAGSQEAGAHGDREPSGEARAAATILGTVILSTVYGLVLSIAFNLTGKENHGRFALRGLGFGLVAFVVVTLVPALAFPLNPPGVEAVASASVRQAWWAAIIFAEIVGLLGYRAVLRRWGTENKLRGHVGGVVVFAACAALPFLAGVPGELKEVLVPASLLRTFRLTSLANLFLFWAALGLLTGWISGWLGRSDEPAGIHEALSYGRAPK